MAHITWDYGLGLRIYDLGFRVEDLWFRHLMSVTVGNELSSI